MITALVPRLGAHCAAIEQPGRLIRRPRGMRHRSADASYDAGVYTDPLYLACLVGWLALWIYWIASIPAQKAERISESSHDRAKQILPMIATYTLLFSPAASSGWLGHRLLPTSRGFAVAAMLGGTMGIALAIWARSHLGSNWSARVSIRAGHELIQSGPYRLIRHPIYTGMILAV